MSQIYIKVCKWRPVPNVRPLRRTARNRCCFILKSRIAGAARKGIENARSVALERPLRWLPARGRSNAGDVRLDIRDAVLSLDRTYAANLLLQQHDSVEQRLGGRGTTWHIDVDRDDAIASAHHRI